MRDWNYSYISRENLLLGGNADYFDYIGWTWNLYQRLPCVQRNKEPKAWIRTKSAYITKQMFWQVWVYVENLETLFDIWRKESRENF